MTSNFSDTGPIRAYAPASDKWFVCPHRSDAVSLRLMLGEPDPEPGKVAVVGELAREGFEFCRPVFVERKRPMIQGRRPGGLVTVREPVFPGYLFVRPLPDRSPRATPLRNIIGMKGQPIGWMPEAAVAPWRQASEARERLLAQQLAAGQAPIEAGHAVEFEYMGQFWQAVVNEVRPDGRLALLFDFMGRSAPFIIDRARAVRVVDDNKTDQQLAS